MRCRDSLDTPESSVRRFGARAAGAEAHGRGGHALQQAQRATSICVEETWNDLQGLCFEHNIESGEVLVAVRAERQASPGS